MEFPDLIFESLSALPNACELDLPFIEYHAVRYQRSSGGVYTCLLCDRRELTEEAVKYHCQEPAHQQAVLKLKSEKERARVILQRWNRIQLVEAPRPPVQASFNNTASNRSTSTAMNRALSKASSSSPSSSLLQTRIDQLGLSAWRDAVQACLFRYLTGTEDTELCLSDAITALRKYEHLERISLLELAVWKATCIVEMPSCTDYYAVTQWFKSGWKIQKEAQRKSGASISIIMSMVVPFLDKPRISTSANNFVYGTTARPWASSSSSNNNSTATARASNRLTRAQRVQEINNRLPPWAVAENIMGDDFGLNEAM